ncbi:MAG: hypothetical protein IJ875_04535 [Solobacterium sp.]|nr:hypothetical protein [Solobacterium sp.]
MDEFIVASGNLANQLLPILGAIALVFLCIMLSKVWKLLDSLTQTVKGLDPTLRLVDKSIEKVQAPLDTVVKYSHSLDNVHDKTADAMSKAADFANENMDSIKGFVKDKISKKDEEIVIDLGEAEDLMKEDAAHVG